MQPISPCASSPSSYAGLPISLPLRRHNNLKNPTSSPSKSIVCIHALPVDGFLGPPSLSAVGSLTVASILSLLQHYTRTSQMRKARKLFDRMREKTPIALAILMSGYALHGPTAEALSLFRGLHAAGRRPDPYDVSIILRLCASLCRPYHGKELHCFSLKAGYIDDLFVANGLVTMYASCGLLRCSRIIFWGIPQPDFISWTAMLDSLIKNGDDDEGLRLLEQMALAGVHFDAYVFSIGLKASANANCIDSGMQIHCCVVKHGLDLDSYLGSCLLEFYGRMGKLDLMEMLFVRLTERDLVAWNTMITCFARSFRDNEALSLFRQMIGEGSLCDDFTLGSVLQAVTSQGTLNHGKEIHGFSIRSGFGFHCNVNSALLHMYIMCTNFAVQSACNSMMPLKLFTYIQSINAEVDAFIITSILKFCASQKDLGTGRTVHSLTLKLMMNSNPFVASALIDMYAKCRLIRTSVMVFAGIVEPSTASWSAIIAGSCFNGYYHEAVELFRMMQFQCTKANEFTYTSVILACLADGKLGGGKEIHCSIIRNGYGHHDSVTSTLIKFYIGLMEPHKAVSLSFFLPECDVPWVSLIRGFAVMNDYTMVLWLFHKIQRCNGKLDCLTASYVFDSCANPQYLNAGTQAHAFAIKRGLVSETNILNSLIDMYSRCGTISDAGDVFDQITEKNAGSWTSIISANVSHGCPSEAVRQFRQMIRRHKDPNCDTFVSVLKACRQMGLVDEAFHLFIDMVEVYKIKPSMETYSCMVEVLNCAGMFREAEHFIESTVPFMSSASAWRTVLSTCKV